MVSEQVLVLSEIASSILQAVPERGSVDIAEVVTHVVKVHGPPAPPLNAETLVRRHVLDLAAHGVMETWPHGAARLSTTMTQAETLEVLYAAMRAAVQPKHSSRWVLPDDVTETELIAAANQHRVTSQLATQVEESTFPETLEARLRANHAALAVASIDLVRDLHQVLAILAGVEVPVLVFKGMPLSAQAWGDYRARGYGDLDLLVAPNDVARTYEALTAEGWRLDSTYPAPGPSWGWRHFIRTEYEMQFSRGRTVIDLHWHALPAHGTFPSFEELWSRRAEVPVGGRPVQTFGLYDALAHSASHSARDHWRWLRGLADVHQLMARPETWEAADRALRGDQLLTVGIAAKLLGVPVRAPLVVLRASDSCSVVLNEVRRNHLKTDWDSETRWVPGRVTVRMMMPLWHTKASPREFFRRLSSSAMPPWALARGTSSSPFVAAPQALWQRTRELLVRSMRNVRPLSTTIRRRATR